MAVDRPRTCIEVCPGQLPISSRGNARAGGAIDGWVGRPGSILAPAGPPEVHRRMADGPISISMTCNWRHRRPELGVGMFGDEDGRVSNAGPGHW
jgi:hypothetical protein